MMEQNEAFTKERYELAVGRIREIAFMSDEELTPEFAAYFQDAATFLVKMDEVFQMADSGKLFSMELSEKKDINRSLYEELLEENYETCYANPGFAVEKLGTEYGTFLAALRAELRSLIAYAYERNQFFMLIRMELFLEIYGLFVLALAENETTARFENRPIRHSKPDIKELKDCYASFAFDYQEEFMEDSVKNSFTTENDFAVKLVREADFSKLDYLYDYGEYISENECRMAAFVNALPEETIQLMADTFTEGYRKGFVATGKDISIKKSVNIRYFIGFERVVRVAMDNFKKIGLDTIINRSQPSFFLGRNVQKVGFYSTQPNKQFECDHEFDKVLYLNSMFINRKLECYKAALEQFKAQAFGFGGPAVIEEFGEAPFSPQEKEQSYRLGKEEQKLSVEYAGKAGMLLNQYVKGEERSFTIIAFPTPAIGEQFEDIFSETIQINTLNYELYRDIQQKIIDTLDTASYVKVKGQGVNETDLSVALWKLQNPQKETIFENCVADVNIPVGEVFTSPVLKGTNGVLHVSEVFLNGLKFENLKLTFTDGMVTDYECSNFEDKQKGKRYIKDHVLHQHDSLPLGEFAIGTNTVAYKAAKKYGIGNVLPILIAEKTGPHFAVGDTCYSHEEDMVTYNADGKTIVARENEISAKRNEDMTKAYFNCHTDITIPYDEIGQLIGVCENGEEKPIILQGRFVLNGCEELNKSL